MVANLKQDLVAHLLRVGAYDVRIASPSIGFEHSLPSQHPLELWPECRSIVVFVVACPPRANNLYFGPYARWHGERETIGEVVLDTQEPSGKRSSSGLQSTGPVPKTIVAEDYAMYRLVVLFLSFITMEAVGHLESKGYSGGPVSLYPVLSKIQRKLCAYEAGIGVYGRSGIIIHPILGNRMRIGVVMTDALLQPDGRLEGFEPCMNCDLCIQMCPARAFDPDKAYPASWSRNKCTAKRRELGLRGLYCHNYLAVCPAGTIRDEDLLRDSEARSVYRQSQPS
jgi:ferredoxin